MRETNPKKTRSARRERIAKQKENVLKFQPKPKMRECRECKRMADEDFNMNVKIAQNEMEQARVKYCKEIETLNARRVAKIKKVLSDKMFCDEHKNHG